MRVLNPGSEPTTARVPGPVTVERVRLDESGRSPIPTGLVEVGPGEIATLRLRTIPEFAVYSDGLMLGQSIP